MSDSFQFYPSENDPQDGIEKRLLAAAQAFAYPPTPDISRAVARRLLARPARRAPSRLAVAGVLLVIVLAIIFAVPPVRAAVLSWIRIGAVRIFLAQPTSTTAPLVIASATPQSPAASPTPTPLQSVLDLSGQTTLEEAQSRSGFTIRLPAYPPDIKQPDSVYYQDMGGPVVILVWMDPENTRSVRMSLSETASDNYIFQKFNATSIVDTKVNGQPAVWVNAPYVLITGSGKAVETRLVSSGSTLIWTQGIMTYRLETGMDMQTAVKIAESLR